MDTEKLKEILGRHTRLVQQRPHVLNSNGLLDLKIAHQAKGLLRQNIAIELGLTLIHFPGIAVGVKMPDARRDGGHVTRLLYLPRKPLQSEMTALTAMTWVSARELDLTWRLRLAAFGHLVNNWQLSRDGREVIWPLVASGGSSIERDAAIARSMLVNQPKKKPAKILPRRLEGTETPLE